MNRRKQQLYQMNNPVIRLKIGVQRKTHWRSSNKKTTIFSTILGLYHNKEPGRSENISAKKVLTPSYHTFHGLLSIPKITFAKQELDTIPAIWGSGAHVSSQE